MKSLKADCHLLHYALCNELYVVVRLLSYVLHVLAQVAAAHELGDHVVVGSIAYQLHRMNDARQLLSRALQKDLALVKLTCRPIIQMVGSTPFDDLHCVGYLRFLVSRHVHLALSSLTYL